MTGARRNLELKARDADPARSLEVCRELGAEGRGTLRQEDTYFKVSRGRLKLRRQDGAVAQLIAYERPDRPGQSESRYRIVEVGDDLGLEQALVSSLGVLAMVRKTRRLFQLENVRIHLDRVEGLGSFIELEAVAASENVDLRRSEASLESLCRAFGIGDGVLVAAGYSDLTLAAAIQKSP